MVFHIEVRQEPKKKGKKKLLEKNACELVDVSKDEV